MIRALTYAILEREAFENVRHSLARGLGTSDAKCCNVSIFANPKTVNAQLSWSKVVCI